MPYIPKSGRASYNGYIQNILNILNRYPKQKMSGELNYIITKLILDIVPMRYDDYNMILGVLESVKMELYRRRIANYENIKCELHGDVY